jgi:hypothetical protein
LREPGGDCGRIFVQIGDIANAVGAANMVEQSINVIEIGYPLLHGKTNDGSPMLRVVEIMLYEVSRSFG